jgi:AraC family transcriptional regulator
MSEQDIKIVTLPPMRVLCFNGFGEGPEVQAIGKLNAWMSEKGLMNDGKTRRFFGYNNPDPAPGSPNYGYDVWVTVDNDTQAEGDARIIDFPGGLYAVLQCPVTTPWDDIPSAWKRLVKWAESSKYQHAPHQWLEEHLSWPDNTGNNFTLDLYFPIKE